MTSEARKKAWLDSLSLSGPPEKISTLHLWMITRKQRNYFAIYYVRQRLFTVAAPGGAVLPPAMAALIISHMIPPAEYAQAVAASITRNHAQRKSP